MTNSTLEITLPVSGMTCASCVSHVEGALKELPGVSNVVVNLATNKASLVYNPQVTTLDDIRRAIENVGYSVSLSELTLDVSGMTCASCVAHVEDALKELPGVASAVVNLGLGTARVQYIPGLATISQMKRAIRNVGYEAAERSVGSDALDRERQAREEEIKRQGRNLLIAGTIGLVVMIGTFYDMLGPLLIVVGAILLIALVALLGGGIAAGGMTMMAGMMSHPVGWIVLLILAALIALLGYFLFFQGSQQTGDRLSMIMAIIGITRELG